jgi:hypothetical protein
LRIIGAGPRVDAAGRVAVLREMAGLEVRTARRKIEGTQEGGTGARGGAGGLGGVGAVGTGARDSGGKGGAEEAAIDGAVPTATLAFELLPSFHLGRPYTRVGRVSVGIRPHITAADTRCSCR